MVDVPAVLAAGLVEPVGDVFVLVGAVVVDDEAHVAAGTLRSMSCRNPKNSWWRCRGRHWCRIWRVAASSAANSVVVPWRPVVAGHGAGEATGPERLGARAGGRQFVRVFWRDAQRGRGPSGP